MITGLRGGEWEIFVGREWGRYYGDRVRMGKIHGNGLGMGNICGDVKYLWGWGQSILPCHSVSNAVDYVLRLGSDGHDRRHRSPATGECLPVSDADQKLSQ